MVSNSSVTSDPYDPDDTEEVELLLHVAFSEAVNMTSLSVHGRGSLVEIAGGDDDEEIRRTAAPLKCKIFVNRTNLDFETARELKGDVELDLVPPEHMHEVNAIAAENNNAIAAEHYNGRAASNSDDIGILATVDYPVRGTKFKYCDNVTLFFGENYSSVLLEDEVVPTEIIYVGFKGKGTNIERRAVETVYESRGMKKDHKVPDGEYGAKHFM